MPDRSFKTRIAACDFEIGIADAGEEYAHKCLVAPLRLFDVAYSQTGFFHAQGFHRMVSGQWSVVRGQLLLFVLLSLYLVLACLDERVLFQIKYKVQKLNH